MLKKLHIENYILIDNLDIVIEKGLNIVTGETGAGKSILLGAVSLLMGGRGDASLIKHGASNLVLEAEFSLKGENHILKEIFCNEDIEYSSELTIRRVITSAGKSKNYVNDEPVTLTFLKDIGVHLVDIHSQHQTILLSNSSFQTSILDTIAGSSDMVVAYSTIYKELTDLRSKINGLKIDNEQATRERDFILYQYEQLEVAKLKEGEKEELEIERDMLSNAAAIGSALYKGTSALYGGDDNIILSLQSVSSAISRISQFVPVGGELVDRLNSMVIEAKDINGEMERLADSVEDNPTRLSEVEVRLDTLLSLEQKHSVGSTLELIMVRDNFAARLNEISNLGEQIEKLEIDYSKLSDKAWKAALDIREARLAASGKLSKSIVERVVMLGMPNANLKVDVSERDTLCESGADNVTFLFSANGSAHLEKIDKVASGGEMSRLMLSLKAIAANGNLVPTIIFDEIDTGVSGKVADKMGDIIEELAKELQIINITHLPQVAAKGKHHFYVYKEHTAGESRSHIKKLNSEERVREIAIMLSGSDITEAALAQASLLIDNKK